MKRSKEDIVFSNLIRERADFTCERCGKNLRHSKQGLDCSHIHSRTNLRTRFDPDAAKALCVACHRWWHDNPTESGKWAEEYFGIGFLEILREKKNMIFKLPKHEKEEM